MKAEGHVQTRYDSQKKEKIGEQRLALGYTHSTKTTTENKHTKEKKKEKERKRERHNTETHFKEVISLSCNLS